ncbi:hypothetical protein GIB67_028515, partial [Kingdonia uniflora]
MGRFLYIHALWSSGLAGKPLECEYVDRANLLERLQKAYQKRCFWCHVLRDQVNTFSGRAVILRTMAIEDAKEEDEVK